MCSHTKRTRAEAHAQNSANWTVQYGKPDGPISSVPAIVRGTISSNALLPTNWRLARGRDKIHDNSRSCGGG
jgi:hypothetical protein